MKTVFARATKIWHCGRYVTEATEQWRKGFAVIATRLRSLLSRSVTSPKDCHLATKQLFGEVNKSMLPWSHRLADLGTSRRGWHCYRDAIFDCVILFLTATYFIDFGSFQNSLLLCVHSCNGGLRPRDYIIILWAVCVHLPLPAIEWFTWFENYKNCSFSEQYCTLSETVSDIQI